MREAVIVSSVRTPVGKFRGALSSISANRLGALVVKEAVERSGINKNEVDEIIFSNLMNHDINNIARIVGLEAGLPITIPGITIDRQCSSSLNALAYASLLIEGGQHDIIVAGGVESDSRRPWIMEKATQPLQLFPPNWATIITSPEHTGNLSMIATAEKLAQMYDISRQECDEFSVWSHQKAANAWRKGYFDNQIIPIEVNVGKGKTILFNKDETLREDTNLDSLSKLKPVEKTDGVVTAGNSSPLSDGAGAMVVMEKNKAKERGLEILGTFRGYAAAGVDPTIMGIGPVPATLKLLKKTGLKLEDIDIFELNEAFAAQSLAVIKEIGIDKEKLNVNGGAIALGHPLAGTGAILVAKILYEMKRRSLHYGIVSFCCAGGLGVSVLLEREE